ncbi:MAG TPA: hypothetical protein VHX61_04830, partial [Rhizomicrobium sp.]|nr:hypothetical protein [Rhizomicrobium sp.]
NDRGAFPGLHTSHRPHPHRFQRGVIQLPRIILSHIPSESAQIRHVKQKMNILMDGLIEVFNAGRVGEAGHIVSQILDKNPTDCDALNFKAEIECQAGHNREAAKHLAHCVQLAPHNEVYRHNYAVVLADSRNLDLSLSETEILLVGNPRNVLFRYLDARILLRNNKYEPALVVLRQLTDEYPEAPEFHVCLLAPFAA